MRHVRHPPRGRRASAGTGRARTARALDRALPPGGIALVTGPSGSGKSTILRLLGEQLAARGDRAIVPSPFPPPERALVDQFRAPLNRTLRLLARVGLADAMLLALHPSQLSEGQRWRLTLALAMEEAAGHGPGATLILDEFASTLDRLSARCLARVLGRSARAGFRIVCATAHDDLAPWLLPAVIVRQPLNAEAQVLGVPEGRS